jgi:hypothetical protein
MVNEIELFGSTNKESIVNGNKERGVLLTVNFVFISVNV